MNNKEKEYLNNVQELLAIAKKNDIFNMTWSEFRKFEDFVELAIEKDIAEEPLEQPYADKKFNCGIDCLCPNCEEMVGVYSKNLDEWVYQNKHCSECGQKINW